MTKTFGRLGKDERFLNFIEHLYKKKKNKTKQTNKKKHPIANNILSGKK